tara:strand:+ start:1098 stop:1940 length:843 start_codon:yes stop_codon:yes gene_type:complete
MEPKIIFLGTAGDHYVTGKSLRSAGGIIIQVEDYQFHLDPGPGSLSSMKNFDINPRETTCVLASHAHLNHCGDINAVLSAMTLNGIDKKGVLICGKSLIQGTEKIKPVIPPYYQNFVERIIIPEAGKHIGIENIEIQTLKTLHSDPHNIGFKFHTPDFVLSYLSDTFYSADLLKQYEKSDILIINNVYPFGTKTKINVNSFHTTKIINKIKPRLAIITHFGKKMIQNDPVEEAREIAKQTMTQVIAATDGMVIMPRSYAANSKQKTLNVFQSQQQDTISN